MEHTFVVGRREYWERFRLRRKEFLNRHHRLIQLANAVYQRRFTSAHPSDSVIFALGVLCWEDYEEILLLGMNGYGFGAQKILRGMYERAVTAAFLHRHPVQVDAFLDFGHISDWKVADALYQAHGIEGISQAMYEEKKRLRDEVAASFRGTCREKGCDREVNRFHWASMDLVAMAKGDEALASLLPIAYYLPMAETHASVRALISRTVITNEGATMELRESNSADEADRVMGVAHHVGLLVMRNQIDHFGLRDLDNLWKECVADFRPSWGSAGSSTVSDG